MSALDEPDQIAARLANASALCPLGDANMYCHNDGRRILVTVTDRDGAKREYIAEVRPA